MSSDRFTINRLPATRADQVSHLISEVIQPLEYYSSDARSQEIAKHSAARLVEYIREDPDAVLVAWEGDEPVGFCVSRYDDGLIWLAWFGVKATHRKNRMGSALLSALAETLPLRRAHKIWCDTRTTNLASQNVLRNAGFRQAATLTNHWYGQDFYLWEK